jgi:hypothetical protein
LKRASTNAGPGGRPGRIPALLTFRREGDTWLTEDVDARIDSLKKLEH